MRNIPHFDCLICMYYCRWPHPLLWGRTSAPAHLQPLRAWSSVRCPVATGPITVSRGPLLSCTAPPWQTCKGWFSLCLTRSAAGRSLPFPWLGQLPKMDFTLLEMSLEQVRAVEELAEDPWWTTVMNETTLPISSLITMSLPHSLCVLSLLFPLHIPTISHHTLSPLPSPG